jgi:molybdopterin/thiamine biosynthesis adenylyltransferase
MTPEQAIRYERNLLLPEIGQEGQEKLLKSRVLIVGVGGLGSPVALYLAAQGVGTLGLVDHDEVSLSNLQRQVLYSSISEGQHKVSQAVDRLCRLNPDPLYRKYPVMLDADSKDRIFNEVEWDVVVDCCDNYHTRYLLNDECMTRKIPLVHGTAGSFDGQVTVFKGNPCYRCLYPNEPHLKFRNPRGVLGTVPGIIGTIQATETLKLLLGFGEPLVGRMLIFDAFEMTTHTMLLTKDPSCMICSK